MLVVADLVPQQQVIYTLFLFIKSQSMKQFLHIISLLLLAPFLSYGQTIAINSSFEDYTPGSIKGQQNWTITNGTGVVVSNSDYAHTGTKGLQLLNKVQTQVDFEPYAKNAAGISDDVYVDLWLKIKSIGATFSITGFDLASSNSRHFLVEFGTDNKIKIFDGSSGSSTIKPTYTLNTWFRISFKLSNSTQKYRFALNGSAYDNELSFREVRATPMDFHSLRFAHAASTTDCDIAIDDMYVGTNPISDISFGGTANARVITLAQPEIGKITLNPDQPEYENGTQVTATLSVPQGYKNAGWTGDLDGTELIKIFTVDRNMTIGANVIIDESDPPAKYLLTVVQPVKGSITITPESADSYYYSHTNITANVSYSNCEQFNGWTGDLSGTEVTKTFTITSNMQIGVGITENTTPAQTRSVKNFTELKSALGVMNPGDIIELADGEYTCTALSVARSGCPDRPIYIKAKNQGKAVLKGKVAFTLKNGLEYLTFEGLTIESDPVESLFKLEGCNNIRITKNVLRMNKLTEGQTSKWILIGDVWNNKVCISHHNRIDHNYFDTKVDGGAWVVLDGAHGTDPGDISKYDRIDHNYFRNNTPRVDNEKETIRLGVSDLTPCSAYCTVEYNLFEDCDGDPEIVSVKSCDNIIRYNTFRRCLGTLSLRQGFRNTVEGNYFFGEGKTVDGNGCGGIRVYAKDHKIFNNYFEGLTGEKWDAACTITNGDNANTSTSYSSHYIPENVIFAFNTYVNNKSNIEIGFTNNENYKKYPVNCQIANNIFIDDTAPIVKAYSTNALAGVSFSNNIMYPTGASSIGITVTESQVKQVDPQLVRSDCRTAGDDCSHKLPYAVYKLTAGSPAINAATGNFDYVTLDFEGQPRGSVKTIGADAYNNTSITAGVLGTEHVGPDAIDFELIVNSHLPENAGYRPVVQVYGYAPGIVKAEFSAQTIAEGTINLYDVNGRLMKSIAIKSSEGMNSVIIPVDLPGGIYIFELNTDTYKATTKFILK